MPKLSLARRHRKAHNLSDLAGNTLLTGPAPRKVSEEEICTSEEPKSLKRRTPSLALSDLLSYHVKKTDSCPSPIPNDENVESPLSPSSPWGHFVELLDDDAPLSFVPSSPVHQTEPYPAAAPKRRKFLPKSSTEHKLEGFVLEAPDFVLDAQDALQALRV